MIRKRILQYLDTKEISKYKFYKDVAISNGFLDKEGSIRSDICEKIIYQYADLNIIWLITGKGEMLKTEAATHTFTLQTDSKQEEQLIPLYDLNATASIIEVFGNSSVAVPMDHIRIPNLPKCDGAIHITGDSMYPLLKSGDIVLYREVQNKKNIIWGEMYLIYINDGEDEFFFCKYIHKSDNPDNVILVSQNKHHQPKEFPIDSIQQLAIVKASIRVNSVV